MKKKFLSALMAAALSVTMLAGCGAKEEAPAPAPEKTETETEAEAPAEETPEAEAPAEEAPAVEPVTLNIAYMPNYGSLWAIENAIDQGYLEEEGIPLTSYSSRMALPSSQLWKVEVLM